MREVNVLPCPIQETSPNLSQKPRKSETARSFGLKNLRKISPVILVLVREKISVGRICRGTKSACFGAEICLSLLAFHAGDRLERLDARVEYVNTPRGTFEVRDRGRTITVSMPFNPGRFDQDRFRRLRPGDQVRIEGYFEGRDRFELETFL